MQRIIVTSHTHTTPAQYAHLICIVWGTAGTHWLIHWGLYITETHERTVTNNGSYYTQQVYHLTLYTYLFKAYKVYTLSLPPHTNQLRNNFPSLPHSLTDKSQNNLPPLPILHEGIVKDIYNNWSNHKVINLLVHMYSRKTHAEKM